MRLAPKLLLSAALAVCAVPVFASSHREAPIVALDQKADITDLYAFRSYDGASATPRVTFILNVDPFLEPANGPNWFPFDPDLLYEIKIDNNNDATEDVVLQVRFTTETRLPAVFQAYVGAGTGINAPANSPPPVAPGTPIVPPAITALDGPGSAGLGQRQSYTVTLVKNGVSTPILNASGGPFFALPVYAGPRTMPNYDALFAQAVYNTNVAGVKVFAGTVDDPFFIDLGAAFDSLNLRSGAGGGVLSPAADANDHINLASDTVSGYAVNSIAIEMPVSMLTSTGNVEPSTSIHATIGVWGSTSRPRTTLRRAPLPAQSSGAYSQIQRLGNPLINELIIGTGSKDRFSMDLPKNDSQFASFFLDPTLARVLNAVYGIPIPTPPRNDLLPLVTYAPPIAAPGTPAGPIADMLRLNTGVDPTPVGSARRLGVLAGDAAGYPNGRRLFDDVVDISLRAVAGIFLGPPYNLALGDGVNTQRRPVPHDVPVSRELAERPQSSPHRSGRSGLHAERRRGLPDQLSRGDARCIRPRRPDASSDASRGRETVACRTVSRILASIENPI